MKFKFNTFPLLGVALLTTVLLFFRIPISILLDKLLVSSFFASFEGGMLKDLIFIIILLAASAWIAKEQSLKFICTGLVFGVIIYLFQRTNEYWNFKN